MCDEWRNARLQTDLVSSRVTSTDLSRNPMEFVGPHSRWWRFSVITIETVSSVSFARNGERAHAWSPVHYGTVRRRVSTVWEASRLPDGDQSMISRESLTHITNDAKTALLPIPPYCYTWRPYSSSLSINIYTIAELSGFKQQVELSLISQFIMY